ncbi:MAG: dienelactone hydrolase family protein [Gammaproteobacteria bacterium]|nr:dienelactone hydrolase family protein [Gammaproteobacteria bacterium]
MSTLHLRASDGHTLSAYVVRPEVTPRGAIVVVQEVFGVNSHIRRVVEQYAAQGYVAIAPALFDRFEKNVELGYDSPGLQQGIAYMMKTTNEGTLADLNAAIRAVEHDGNVGMVGYCWGGRATYLSACHSNIAAGVAYYGGGMAQLLPDTPRCPMMFHFGERDSHIPLADVEKIRAAYPSGVYHLYPAGHGFNCSERADFDAPSAHLAFDRTIEFFRKHIG